MAEAQQTAATVHVVRMGMTVDEAERLSGVLLRCPEDVAKRVYNQLWLRSVFVEQMRRTRIDERGVFATRADEILEALDPQETA